jgi:hypothetical protein
MGQLPAFLAAVLGDAFIVQATLCVGFVLLLNVKSALMAGLRRLSDAK